MDSGKTYAGGAVHAVRRRLTSEVRSVAPDAVPGGHASFLHSGQ